MKQYISIKEASLIIGVTTTTLRRWESDSKLIPHHRTLGNHRRYKLNDILNIINPQTSTQTVFKKTVCYARVSSHDQKDDLIRQTKVLEKYTKDNGITNSLLISDIGSGMNYKKKGLSKLIKLILNNEVDKIILTHKDRLLRFGSDLIINIAKQFNVETLILNKEDKTFEQELASDVIEIITVFSAKLYGSRSHKNKQFLEKQI